VPRNDLPLVRPICGVPGGWRDVWDEPDDCAELRARVDASERRQERRAEVLGAVWQGEIDQESAGSRTPGSVGRGREALTCVEHA